MTVKELREKLSQLDDKIRVVVYAEDEPGQPLFEIDDVSVHTGTSTRVGDGKAEFTFGKDGTSVLVVYYRQFSLER